MTGIKDDNRPEFERVRRILQEEGCPGEAFMPDVCIPHDVVPAGTGWKDAMRLSIAEMLSVWTNPETFEQVPSSFIYEGVAMLDGWEQSKGARIEHDLATALGIPCKPWKEWIK